MSSENRLVNRHLKDKAMDLIDHALGRPVWPLRESFRNHFATDANGDRAKDFDASPYWRKNHQHSDMAFYGVTDAGRQALADHLATLDVQHRAFVVTYQGHSRIIAARSRGAARYSSFLEISDCYSELTFLEYVKDASVRIAA